MHILHKENPARVASGGASKTDLAWQRIGSEATASLGQMQGQLAAYVIGPDLLVQEVRYG